MCIRDRLCVPADRADGGEAFPLPVRTAAQKHVYRHSPAGQVIRPNSIEPAAHTFSCICLLYTSKKVFRLLQNGERHLLVLDKNTKFQLRHYALASVSYTHLYWKQIATTLLWRVPASIGSLSMKC